jgi:hypothetical protein
LAPTLILRAVCLSDRADTQGFFNWAFMIRAIAKERQGQRLSAVLPADALLRQFDGASTVGSSMVVVDALDGAAVELYAAHGFVRLPDSPRLVLPMRLSPGMLNDDVFSRSAP